MTDPTDRVSQGTEHRHVTATSNSGVMIPGTALLDALYSID